MKENDSQEINSNLFFATAEEESESDTNPKPDEDTRDYSGEIIDPLPPIPNPPEPDK